MDMKVGALTSILKPKMGPRMGDEAGGDEPDADEGGDSAAADAAAEEFVSNPTASTFRDLMDLCKATDYKE